VWRNAVDIAVDIYGITASFPVEEKYHLASQMRDAAVSIPSNVAEGEGRWWFRDRLRFLGDARGSLYELDTQVAIGGRVGYIPNHMSIRERLEEEARLINGTIRHLTQQSRKRWRWPGQGK
jgi:four helix bundle protein